MRKFYILRSNEEDGRVLDEMIAQQIDPEQLENPTCPRCGEATLIAYEEDGDYEVMTWYCLTEEDEKLQADAWYLICQSFDCSYEERVERVFEPEGAELFDLEQSHQILDEETGLPGGRHPASMKELIAYLEAMQKHHSHRKLGAFLEEARWRYKDSMKRVRKWMQRIPQGRTISFHVDGEGYEARFVTATDEMLLVQVKADGQMMAVRAEDIDYYSPHRFDEEEKDPAELERLKNDPDGWIRIVGSPEYVVVKGFHLQLFDVDRFGLFQVITIEPAAGRALGFTQVSDQRWDGAVRRSQIEARYHKEYMVKVKGYWVRMYGETSRTRQAAVSTESAEVASALGLKADKPIWPDEMLSPEAKIPRWRGTIPPDEIEERDEVIIYQWPIPEAKTYGRGGEKENS